MRGLGPWGLEGGCHSGWRHASRFPGVPVITLPPMALPPSRPECRGRVYPASIIFTLLRDSEEDVPLWESMHWSRGEGGGRGGDRGRRLWGVAFRGCALPATPSRPSPPSHHTPPQRILRHALCIGSMDCARGVGEHRGTAAPTDPPSTHQPHNSSFKGGDETDSLRKGAQSTLYI